MADLTATDRETIRLLGHVLATVSDFAKAAGIANTAAYQRLERLRARGIVVRHDRAGTRAHLYEVHDPAGKAAALTAAVTPELPPGEAAWFAATVGIRSLLRRLRPAARRLLRSVPSLAASSWRGQSAPGVAAVTRTGWLNWRDYRWMWAYRGLQVVLLLVLIVPTFVLYWPAKGLVWAYERVMDWRAAIYVRCYNHDLARRNGLARKPGAAEPQP